MALYDDMHQLTQNLLAARDDRRAAVLDVRVKTAAELAEFHTTRQDMAVEQQQWLDEHMAGLRSEVGEMRRDAVTFLTETDAAHQAMTAAQWQQLDAYMIGLCRKVENLRQDAATFVQELDAAQQALAAEQSKHLAEERARLASGTAAFLGDADAAHRAMAAAQQQWLATERAQLALDVGGLRAGFQAELGAVRADQGDARRVWATFLQQRQGDRPSPAAAPPPSAAPPPPPPPSPPVEEPAAPPAPAAEAAPDDLTAIQGIGPAMKERLNQVGIDTFAQIARSTPDALRELLGDAGRLAKVESWIDQAHDMGST